MLAGVIDIDARHHNSHINDQETLVYTVDATSKQLEDSKKAELIQSCCRLGHNAGEKGFLCQSSFYQSSIRDRNVNRPHVRTPITETDIVIIKEFEVCSLDRTASLMFDRCCRKAVREEQFSDNYKGSWKSGPSSLGHQSLRLRKDYLNNIKNF